MEKNKAILIEYLFTDEDATSVARSRNSYIVLYDTATTLGKKLQDEFELDEPKELDDLLFNAFGIKDEDVVFYLDNPMSDDIDYIEKELLGEGIVLKGVVEVIEEDK